MEGLTGKGKEAKVQYVTGVQATWSFVGYLMGTLAFTVKEMESPCSFEVYIRT